MFFSFVEKKPAIADIGVSILEKYLEVDAFDFENDLQNYFTNTGVEKNLENILQDEINKLPASLKSNGNSLRFLMGKLMPQLGGYISAQKISTIISKFLNV